MDQYGEDTANEWIENMVANGARYYPNNRSIVEAVGRGEISMGLVNHYYNYQEKAANGSEHRAENFDFRNNDIGSLLIIPAATILESSTNVEAAEDFLQYLLSSSVQEYFTNQTYEYPIAAGVSPNSALPELGTFGVGSVSFEA